MVDIVWVFDSDLSRKLITDQWLHSYEGVIGDRLGGDMWGRYTEVMVGGAIWVLGRDLRYCTKVAKGTNVR